MSDKKAPEVMPPPVDFAWKESEIVPTNSVEWRKTKQYQVFAVLGEQEAKRMQVAARKNIAGALYYPLKYGPAVGLLLIAALLLTACGNGSSAQSQSASLPAAPQVINGITVPPEPDPATNNATLLGVDSNNNSVRDDVERQIASTYGANAGQYEGALRIAKSDQSLVAANGDPVKSTAATLAAATSGFCMYSKLGYDGIAATKAINYLSPLTFNTSERMAAYRATTAASAEVATPVPTIPCQ